MGNTDFVNKKKISNIGWKLLSCCRFPLLFPTWVVYSHLSLSQPILLLKNKLTWRKKERKERAKPILILELETPKGAFVGAIVLQCWRQRNVFAVKNWRPSIKSSMSRGDAKFRIDCLDMDILNTALVAIHNACCNPFPESTENRLLVWKCSCKNYLFIV